jgi:hypothetical protein
MFSKKNRTSSGSKPAADTAETPKQTVVSASKGKLAYEARRAEKAGVGLEKWMAEKDRRVQAERKAMQRARSKSEPGRLGDAAKPGLLRRLLDRAHRPL